MPLVAFSFGAFGDIATVCGLLTRVVQALSSSTGASTAYQALIMELDCFHDCLVHLEHLLERARVSHHARPGAGLPFRQQHVEGFTRECRRTVHDIGARVLEFQKKLKRRSPHNGWMESWRKIGWGLFTENEISRYREDVRRHMSTVHALTTAVNSAILYDVVDTISSLTTPALQAHSSMNTLLAFPLHAHNKNASAPPFPAARLIVEPVSVFPAPISSFNVNDDEPVVGSSDAACHSWTPFEVTTPIDTPVTQIPTSFMSSYAHPLRRQLEPVCLAGNGASLEGCLPVRKASDTGRPRSPQPLSPFLA
ncbi:hypothetical protein PUNSTDRAFT_129949 [Punctularia strigosozonata HHB-11173 SS5]|uniref:uncharacterized protein n=1 Tax=Punctularia strigosozonata (strain HHB-11173) TaxID=741275 RepID=UPI000441630D|nr:uncharacterized protein PUNSTDRAFT_129949 [Punctularia strigosozonata HHB-11173 SS5]EIN14313.1 hypothetical protein PUNSTDRAFT_129949 [Punctularia strigosozonata HHB-11173 SS5]